MIVVSLSLDLLFDAPALLFRSLSTIFDAPGYTECLRSLGAGPPAARASPSLVVSRTVVPTQQETPFPPKWALDRGVPAATSAPQRDEVLTVA